MKLVLDVYSAQEENLTNVSPGCCVCAGVDGIPSGIALSLSREDSEILVPFLLSSFPLDNCVNHQYCVI